jgi:GT2 family glycosyltransferase
VTVVLVNYNGGEMILRALDHLDGQTHVDFRVIVVDNASTDGSVASIRHEHPEVEVIEAGANLGFAAANNLALKRAAGGEYVALLNPDAFPRPPWLAELVKAADREPGGAAFGSRMYMDEDSSLLDGVGDVYHVSGLTWREGHTASAAGRFTEAKEIFSPCAAAALYRTAALQQIGGFNEALFMYLEDVDAGFRLRLAGWTCWYVPTAEVQHLGSGIVGTASDFQIYHGHRNLVWTYVQDMPGWTFWAYLPAHVALNVYSLAAIAMRGHGGAMWRAKRDAVRGLPAAWRRRRSVQRDRVASPSEVRRAMTGGWPRRQRRREGQRP